MATFLEPTIMQQYVATKVYRSGWKLIEQGDDADLLQDSRHLTGDGNILVPLLQDALPSNAWGPADIRPRAQDTPALPIGIRSLREPGVILLATNPMNRTMDLAVGGLCAQVHG